MSKFNLKLSLSGDGDLPESVMAMPAKDVEKWLKSAGEATLSVGGKIMNAVHLTLNRIEAGENTTTGVFSETVQKGLKDVNAPRLEDAWFGMGGGTAEEAAKETAKETWFGLGGGTADEAAKETAKETWFGLGGGTAEEAAKETATETAKETASILLGPENPVFKSFAVAAGILGLTFSVAAIGIKIKSGIMSNDIRSDARADELQRIYRNDIESVSAFWSLSLLYICTEPPEQQAAIAFGTFAGARFAHMLMFLANQRTPRFIAYSVGMGVNTFLAFKVIQKFL